MRNQRRQESFVEVHHHSDHLLRHFSPAMTAAEPLACQELRLACLKPGLRVKKAHPRRLTVWAGRPAPRQDGPRGTSGAGSDGRGQLLSRFEKTTGEKFSA